MAPSAPTARRLAAAAVLALTFAGGSVAWAQLPPGVFAGQRDARLAPAGEYKVDPAHTAVIARVSHIGYGLSVFRFEKVVGDLHWAGAQPGRSTLNVTVETASIATPVPGFAKELSGDAYLKSAAFPNATFVSTAFQRIDANHGKVSGRFTLMGKTRPVTFDVSLLGAGKGFMGHPRLGVEAVGHINPQDYGLNPMFGSSIELVIDAEFERK